MTTEARVSSLPTCSFCNKKAEYDFSTIMGQWAYGCNDHWIQYRASGHLGLGLGQKLILVPSKSQPKEA